MQSNRNLSYVKSYENVLFLLNSMCFKTIFFEEKFPSSYNKLSSN